MVLLAVIPRTPHTEELLNKLYANAGIAGFGLLLTAIIQTCLNQLSLFDAFFILHILFFLGTGVSPMGKYHWTKGRVVMGVLVQFVSVITFTAWGLYVLADVKNFGNVSDCNDQIKYVVFFFTVRATAPWLRGIWIAVLVLSAVVLMLSFGWHAMELFEMKRMAEELQTEEIDANACREVTVMPGARSHAEMEAAGETAETEKAWYFDISFTLLMCVAPLLSYHRHSRIAAQLSDIFYGHARTHSESPYLSYSTYYSLNRVPGATKSGATKRRRLCKQSMAIRTSPPRRDVTCECR